MTVTTQGGAVYSIEYRDLDGAGHRLAIRRHGGPELLNARYRNAVQGGGHFPTEQAALKSLYLVTRSLDSSGKERTRRTQWWKPALNAFTTTSAERWPGVEAY